MSESLAGIPAFILAGGLGTRLRPAVSDRPKALAEVAGRPFLAWLLDGLAAAGVRRAVLCTGYRGEMIRQAVGDRFQTLALDYSQETEPLGTGGAVRAALPLCDSPRLLVLNGDSLCRADLARFARQHAQRGAACSLVLARVEDTSRYGRVETAADGRLTQFVEKGDAAGPGWINAGVYLFQRPVIEGMPPARALSLERDLFPAWLGRGLYGHQQDGPFLDIGTPESYSAAVDFVGDRCR
jgi:NDP-sugar pyrophosphorylase family protein